VNISAWEEDLDYSMEQIGYAKVDGKWGVALRTVSANHNWPDQDVIEQWLFSDAPGNCGSARLKEIIIEPNAKLFESLLKS
jgi:hypothetical protein